MDFNFNEFMDAVLNIEEDGYISRRIILDALKHGIESAVKKGDSDNEKPVVSVDIDEQRGELLVYRIRRIVEDEMVDETRPHEQIISLSEARRIDPNAQLGGTISDKLSLDNLSRVATHTIKTVLKQQLKAAEDAGKQEEYGNKINEVLSARVTGIDPNGTVYVEIGKDEGVLLLNEQIPGERYSVGQMLKVELLRVGDKASSGRAKMSRQLIVSRKRPGLVKRLFEIEVPEIKDGTVEIVSVAREAGERTKIAVKSNDPKVGALGACVGQNSSRIVNIRKELGNEKIDIIPWDSDGTMFVANALRPAVVLSVIELENRHARVTVAANVLSLAIGKRGINVRLAAKLTGWKIDVQSVEDGTENGNEAYDE